MNSLLFLIISYAGANFKRQDMCTKQPHKDLRIHENLITSLGRNERLTASVNPLDMP